MNDAALLEALITAVRRVGDDVVMPGFLKTTRRQKADGSLVTEADIAAQAALVGELGRISSYPVLGEEMTQAEQEVCWQAGADGVWCVDPIDGTSNFANGLPYFCVSVALVRAGRPVLGVVYAPASGEMFSALAGGGAFLNGQRLPLTAIQPALHDAIAAVDLKNLPKSVAVSLVAEPPYYSQRSFGAAALEWCYLAAGRCDVYLYGKQMLWDYAAGCLVLQEAGGLMRTLDCADFWAGPVWSKSVIASLYPELFHQWADNVVARIAQNGQLGNNRA